MKKINKISKFTKYLLIEAARIAKDDDTPITKEEIDKFKLSDHVDEEEIENLGYSLEEN